MIRLNGKILKAISIKVRNQIRMPSIMVSIQHYTGGPGPSYASLSYMKLPLFQVTGCPTAAIYMIQPIKERKKFKNWKGRLPVCEDNMIVYVENPREYTDK